MHVQFENIPLDGEREHEQDGDYMHDKFENIPPDDFREHGDHMHY